jgi:hypothetical protein
MLYPTETDVDLPFLLSKVVKEFFLIAQLEHTELICAIKVCHCLTR